MTWDVEYTDEFENWWNSLSDDEQDDVAANVELLSAKGVGLGFPKSSDVKGSKYGNLRELRVKSGGKQIRVFYAFDPRRVAILLIGGTKGDRFYESMIPIADRLYEDHIEELRKEGLIE